MNIITDRGVAVIRKSPDGETHVAICMRLDRGRLVDVFAIHSRVESLIVDPRVRLEGPPDLQHSVGPVEVWREPVGTLHIDPGREDSGLLGQPPFVDGTDWAQGE